MVRPIGNPASAGFTLLELLLSITLVSFLGLTAFTAISICLKATRSQEQYLVQSQQVRVGQQILERSLSSAARKMQAPGDWPYFVGEQQEMRFLTQEALEAHNLGGLNHWRVLAAQSEAGQPSLFVEEAKALTWYQSGTRVETRIILIPGVTSLKIAYGLGGYEYDRWDSKRRRGLPEWVRLRFTLGDKTPVEWIIPLHVNEKEND